MLLKRHNAVQDNQKQYPMSRQYHTSDAPIATRKNRRVSVPRGAGNTTNVGDVYHVIEYPSGNLPGPTPLGRVKMRPLA